MLKIVLLPSGNWLLLFFIFLTERVLSCGLRVKGRMVKRVKQVFSCSPVSKSWCFVHNHELFKKLRIFFLSRLIRLMEEIMSEKENKTIVFVETKRRCDELTRKMRRDGYVWLSSTKADID